MVIATGHSTVVMRKFFKDYASDVRADSECLQAALC